MCERQTFPENKCKKCKRTMTTDFCLCVLKIPFQCEKCHIMLSNLSEFQNHMRSTHSVRRNSNSFVSNKSDTGLENVSFSNSSSICKSLEKTQETLIGACIDENKPGEKTNQSRFTNDIVELHQAGTRKDIFRTKLKLLTHKMSHAKKNVISTCMCKYCNRTFMSTVRLHIHITKMHKEKTRYICDVCNKGFSSANTLEAHKRLHMGIKPYKCDLCEKSYSQSGNLTYHKSTHVGVKSYVCHLCGKAFLTSGILANHERRHTGLKPYICDVCGRAFADNYTLTHHKVVHSGVRSFMCDVCGKVFVHKDTLASHKRIHSGEKKYKCTICNHAFTQMSTMLQHRNTHTGEKSYRCRCGKAFTQQSSLARHKRLHDEEVKSFSCHMCGKKFAYKSTLYKHTRRTHGVLNLHTYSEMPVDIFQ